MTCRHVWVTFELLNGVLTQECALCKKKRRRAWAVRACARSSCPICSVSTKLQAFVSNITRTSFDKLSSEAADANQDLYKFFVARALDKDMVDVTSKERAFVKLALFYKLAGITIPTILFEKPL